MLVYPHDLEKAIYGVHNCLNLNFQEIFTYGFRTSNGDVSPPASFSTACQLVAMAFQCQSQVQFGGVGSIHFDYDLAPFVKKSFFKHHADGLKYLNHLSDEAVNEIMSEYALCNSSIGCRLTKMKTIPTHTLYNGLSDADWLYCYGLGYIFYLDGYDALVNDILKRINFNKKRGSDYE